MFEKIIKSVNGHKIEYEPIIYDCTYYSPDKNGVCRNCNGTKKYIDGYYMIIDDKTCFMVDNIK